MFWCGNPQFRWFRRCSITAVLDKRAYLSEHVGEQNKGVLMQVKLFFRNINTLSTRLINQLTFVFITIIGVIDWITGWEQSFSVFYLIPIAIVSWHSGRRAGMSAAIYSTIASYLADYFLTI